MTSVFLLWHAHNLDDGETDEKLIGVYSNRQQAEAAQQRRLRHPGFRDAPDGFLISELEVDRDQWTEGYVTV